MTNIPETKTTDVILTTAKSVERVYETLPTVMPRVVIVGAGFGGLQVAKALGDVPVHVTVIE